MVQEFHVLRCYSCQTFQVQQVKKVKKWNCKMCGEKQSILKEFGRGSGADCRHHVQTLNAKRGEMQEEQEQKAWSLWEEKIGLFETSPPEAGEHNGEECSLSRWDKYLDAPQEEQEPGEEAEGNVCLSRSHLHGNTNVRKRKRAGWRIEDDDDGYLNEGVNHKRDRKLVPLPNNSRSFTVQQKITNQPAPKQSKPGLTRATTNPGSNQTKPGFARASINRDSSQAMPGFIKDNGDSNQAMPGFIKGNRDSCRDRVPLSNQTCQVRSSATLTTSRWSQFLAHPCPQEEEEHEEIQENLAGAEPASDVCSGPAVGQSCCIKELSGSGHFNNTEGKPLYRLGSPVTSWSLNSMREPCSQSEAVSLQTPPNNQPCTALHVSSLFNTGDDIDAFTFDDMF